MSNYKEDKMIFKSSSVALLISTALTSQVYASDQLNTDKLSVVGNNQHPINVNSDATASFKRQHETKGIYILQLSEKSALDKEYAHLGNDRKAVVAKIDAQQKSIEALIKSLDSDAVITQKIRLVDNLIRVQMTHEAVEQLKSNQEIISINETSAQPNMTADNAFKPYPFLTIKDPGDAVTVAIIGSGVDYTHAALNGTGTTEAYDKAWENRSNAWDGFPTDTVIGGLDLSASLEGYHIDDYNPIEDKNFVLTNDYSYHYPSGTAQAALVLAQAPDAKILAYKALDYDRVYFYAATDVAVDPNQDGDFSDRPDILLINSYGSGAFYQVKGNGTSSTTRQINHVRRLAGLGSLVVAPAGTYYFDTFHSLAPRGATPEALTVGSVNIDNEHIVLSPFTPAGPSRGDDMLKPDVVAQAEGLFAAKAGTGDGTTELVTTAAYAAANAAGVAARVWAREPNLSSLEVKALVANTAISEGITGIKETVNEEGFSVEITKVAEVPFMGTGLVSAENIDKAQSVLWETGSYQPSLAFGHIDVASTVSETRNITLKNLSNKPQSYSVSLTKNGEKSNNAAVSFVFPETVSVPANTAITFPVTLTINDELLTNFPLTKGSDYSIEKWAEAAINGYLTFTNTNAEANDAMLKMGWLVYPKKATQFTKSNTDLTSSLLPLHSDDYRANNTASGWWTEGNLIDITNEGNSERTIVSLPLIHNKDYPDARKDGSQGHIIKSVGSKVYPNEQCESGQAIAISIEMFDPIEIAMAEHMDRGSHLVTMRAYNAAYANAQGAHPDIAERNATDADLLFYFQVELDDSGKPFTKYIDYSMEFDHWNPTARYRRTSLETNIAPGGKIVMVNTCMDDLYREEYPGLASFNEKLGWQFGTDRDAVSSIHESMVRFNPVLGGDFWQEIVDHTGEDGYPNWWDTNCQPKSWKPDNCIESATFFLAFSAGSAVLPADVVNIDPDERDLDTLTWSPMTTIAAGESAVVYSGITAQCDPGVVSTGNWITHEDCPAGIIIFELENNNISKVPMTSNYDSSALANQSFNVYESVANGTVVGTVKIVSAQFFASDEQRNAQAYLINALPGIPFALSTDGELTVINADALDYESLNKHYVLQIQVDHENRDSGTVEVIVNVSNNNDIAPMQVNKIATMTATVGTQFTTNIAKSFTDVEGDGVSFTSSDLPSGLNIDLSGNISGKPEEAGDISSTIIVSDGMNQTTSSVSFSIAANNSSTPTTPATPANSAPENSAENSSDSSGGSFGFVFLMLASLSLLNRRTK